MFSKLLLFGAGDWTQSLTHDATQVLSHETVYPAFEKQFSENLASTQQAVCKVLITQVVQKQKPRQPNMSL